MSSTQGDRNIQRGKFETIKFDLLRVLISDEKIKKFQGRIRDSEQNIQLSLVFDYLQRACDSKYSVESLEKIALFEANQVPFDPAVLSTMSMDQIVVSVPYEGAMREVVEYYGSVYSGLSQVESKEDIPYLPELSLVFDRNGQVIGDYSLTEYSRQHQAIIRYNRRILTRDSSDIPKQLKNAIVSIEDSDFYDHTGVDLRGALRAIHNTGSGESIQGASTITMQLAKNLLLYKEVFAENVEKRRSLLRKLQEYILVKRLESVLSKDEILELYFNTIDFGRGVQGIVLAAKVYFGKDLNELNLQEMAFLAGLPKSPYGLDPSRNMQRALERRNRVLRDMLRQDYITRAQYTELSTLPIETLPANRDKRVNGYSMHYVNAVQKQIQSWATSMEQNAYVGLEVITPINHKYQRWAVESLQRGLLNYERKRRTRGGKKVLTVKPDEDQLPNIKEQVESLAEERGVAALEVFQEILEPIKNRYPDASQFNLGVILSDTKIGLKDGTQVDRQSEDRAGKLYKVVNGNHQNLEVWDVVMLEPFLKKPNGETEYKIASFTDVQGSVVVIDNKTGAVLATAGGFSVGAGGRYKGPGNNRAFSSLRQPGSTIKPFVYLYALNNGIAQSQFVSNSNVTLPEIRREGSRLCRNWILTDKILTDKNKKLFYSLNDGLVRSKNKATVHAFMRASGVQEWEDPMFSQKNLEQGLLELTNTFKSFGLYKDRDKAKDRDRDGDEKRNGDGDGDGKRNGNGDGDGKRNGDGDGDGRRNGNGDGDGDGRRNGDGDGNGNGDGKRAKDGDGNGDGKRAKDGDGKYFCYPVILGTHEVKAVDMAGAYATIARGGGYVVPFTATKLRFSRNNKTLENPLNKFDLDVAAQNAISEEFFHDSVSFFGLKKMLQGVVAHSSISKWSPIMGGKTGTTQNNKDAWFIGFNKEITVAVWVGYLEKQTLGNSFGGARVALPIFKDFMEQYYETYPEKKSDVL